MDSRWIPNFPTHGAPLRARESSAIKPSFMAFISRITIYLSLIFSEMKFDAIFSGS